MKYLVLGGARSGKSRYAQQLAVEGNQDVIYIATAHAGDGEMQARIERHKTERPSHWLLIEEKIKLADMLLKNDAEDKCILVDCLTLWLTNLLCDKDESLMRSEINKLLEVLPNLEGKIIFVSNEVGQGIVPLGEVNRRFVDEAGWLHQALAELCEHVVFLVAGLPQRLK